MRVLSEQEERRNRFLRISIAGTLGISIGHLFNFNNPIIFSLYSIKLMMPPGKFNHLTTLKQLFVLSIGMFLGLYLGNVSGYFAFPSAIFMFLLSLFVLNSYRTNKNKEYSYNIYLGAAYLSIFSSYPNSKYYVNAYQYLMQMVLLFILLSILHAIFPSTQKIPEAKPYKEPKVSLFNLSLDALALSSFWIFSMLFEWRFAFFAFITVVSLYKDYDYKSVIAKCKANMIINTLSCTAAAMFTVLLFGMGGNWLLFTLGLFLLYSPAAYKFCYHKENTYFNAVFVVGLSVPLSVYLKSTDITIVYQAHSRAIMISSTMAITLFLTRLRGK